MCESERYKYYKLAEELKQYSYARKGEIARLTWQAGDAIETLAGKIKALEEQIKNEEDDLK